VPGALSGIRPPAIIAIGDKAVTRGRHPLFAAIAAARLLVGKLRHWDCIWMTDDDETLLVE